MRILNTKIKVHTLLDKLHELVENAANNKTSEPEYDLCQIQVDGVSIFCDGNLGIARAEMPQLKGVPDAGSWADANLMRDESGEVNAEKSFRKLLESKGISIHSTKMPASMLKATQNQLNGGKVAGMLNTLKNEPTEAGLTAPIFVSKDGYILDGHHRWAALVGLEMHPEHDSVMLNCDVIDLGIDELLILANNFINAVGIKNKEIAKMRILATVDRSKNHDLKTLQEVKDYFAKGDILTVINIGYSRTEGNTTKFKIGDKLVVTGVTNAGVWTNHKRLKFEYCMNAPDNLNTYTNADNNNFTYSNGKTEITFTKSK